MKVKRDGFDLELIQRFADSDGYAMVRERLTQTHSQAIRDLIHADSLEKMYRLQERITTLEMVLSLPTVIATEIRQGLKK
jgi:hypothetical protein